MHFIHECLQISNNIGSSLIEGYSERKKSRKGISKKKKKKGKERRK
jgi:hypothetical protein